VSQHAAEAGKLLAGIMDLARAAGVALDTVLVQSNDVYAQIIAMAKKKRCDLICMASHGRRSVAGVILGSETHKVLTHKQSPGVGPAPNAGRGKGRSRIRMLRVRQPAYLMLPIYLANMAAPFARH